MRHGCDTRLRNAFYHWARVSTQLDAHSRAQYAALRGNAATLTAVPSAASSTVSFASWSPC